MNGTDRVKRVKGEKMDLNFGTTSKPLNKPYKTFSMELCGRTLSVDIGRASAQANGACLMHYGNTTILATATASKEPRDGVDFFPLSVEYEEKMYAVGKIPGGFNKREGKASEHAILTSRVIDRPMRPLFPKDYRKDVLLDGSGYARIITCNKHFGYPVRRTMCSYYGRSYRR